MHIGERIRHGRIKAGLSLRALAEKIGVTAPALGNYENGITTPDSSRLISLAEALDISIDYFFRQEPVILLTPLAYRKKSRFGRKKEEQVIEITRDWLERFYAIEDILGTQNRPDLPERVIASSPEEIEHIALDLRKRWGLGDEPIQSLMDIMEQHGIKVCLIDGPKTFDGMIIMVNDEIPVIVINRTMSGDRQRLTLAHELGHLICTIPDDWFDDTLFHRFAGAFLFPDERVRSEFGGDRKKISIEELCILKHRYGISMMAILYRAFHLGLISGSFLKSMQIRFRKNGWDTCEPMRPYPPENPTYMNQLILRAYSEGMITRTRANELYGGDISTICGCESCL